MIDHYSHILPASLLQLQKTSIQSWPDLWSLWLSNRSQMVTVPQQTNWEIQESKVWSFHSDLVPKLYSLTQPFLKSSVWVWEGGDLRRRLVHNLHHLVIILRCFFGGEEGKEIRMRMKILPACLTHSNVIIKPHHYLLFLFSF